METRINRYSRVLVPLPPVQSIKDEVSALVKETFKVIPEYVETSDFEGYAISWRAWYGFEDCLRHPSARSFFPLRLKRIIDSWLDSDEENMQVIEWIDEERYEWLDVVKDAEEIFYASYLGQKVHVFSETILHYISNDIWKEYRLTYWEELEKLEKLYPVLKVLARRGYWNLKGLIVTTERDEFYKKIGFDFTLPFK